MSTSKHFCRQFSLDEIRAATRNFDNELIIGKGGFGLVYIGSIDDGANVAIKRLSSESTQGETEFLREVETLSKLQHANLVRLLGYCNESPEKILVYEYIPNGSLVDHLYKRIGDNQASHLSWEQRLNICIGAAQGLDFLHRQAVPGVIHRDIKASNILLEADFMAKIADFGLAKLVKTTSDPRVTTVSTTIFKGTFGYMDPEYFYTQRLTTKTDVYAFGVVMLVVLSGKPAVDKEAVEDQRSLAEWAIKCIEKNRIVLIVDPSLVGEISSKSLKEFVKISHKCLCRRSEERPTMEEVVAGLELALRKQAIPGSSNSRQPNGRSSLTQMVIAKLQITMQKKQPNEEKWVLSDSMAGSLCHRFSLDEIKTATQNFSDNVGHGDFGSVYLGRINHGADIVAIKCFKLKSVFFREIETLCKLQHDNIICLRGYCYESSTMIIVYEYMANGSLDENRHVLSWEQRLNICLGAAHGLDFLHKESIIHRDVKCVNIMLDDNFVPKITDFALAEIVNSEGYATSNSIWSSILRIKRKKNEKKERDSILRGTDGYMAPECKWGSVTKKIDVYSFGVVLFVVLSGRYKFDYGIHLLLWAKKCIREDMIFELIDPHLRGQIKSESLEKFLEVAQNCLHEEPKERHTMEDVVAGLELALEKQLDSTSSQWVESHGLPNLVCLLEPKKGTMQDEEYSDKDMQELETSDEGEYSSELYDEFLEEYSDM